MILCIGLSPAVDVTYRVDQLAVGGTNRVSAVERRPGGKAVNVARILHALGDEVRLLAPIGGDSGAEFAADLADLGLPADLVPSGYDTRRTVAVVDGSGDATLFVEPARIDCWPEVLAAASALIERADAVVISGALPSGVPVDAMSKLVNLAHQHGAPVLVDTSGAALADALSGRPTMVKPNADELAEATGERDPVPAARSIALRHETTVVASLGADGLIAATSFDSWRARPAQALSGNPTGAGDALVAALARGLRDGIAVPHVLPECIALSAAAVLSPYAGQIDPSHYAAQRDGVTVHKLDHAR